MIVNGKEIDLNPQDIIQELLELRHKLSKLNAEIIRLGNHKSQCEFDYKLAKAKKIVEIRSQGHPVTLVTDLVKGHPEIAELKMKLDASETLYDNKRENIRSIKDIMSCYQSILNYLKAEITNGLKTDY